MGVTSSRSSRVSTASGNGKSRRSTRSTQSSTSLAQARMAQAMCKNSEAFQRGARLRERIEREAREDAMRAEAAEAIVTGEPRPSSRALKSLTKPRVKFDTFQPKDEEIHLGHPRSQAQVGHPCCPNASDQWL